MGAGNGETLEAMAETAPHWAVDAPNVNGDTPLMFACFRGSAPAVAALLKHGFVKRNRACARERGRGRRDR
eukprot:7294199-Pyramimonas_sp.AAC.1